MIVNRHALLWLVPIFITLHNLEEALFMPDFLEARNTSIPGFLNDLLPPITYRQSLIALLIVTVIPYFIAWLANLERTQRPGITLLLTLQVVMLFNVLAHAMMAIVVRGYAPGVITAFAINLPFSIHLLRRAFKERWVSRRALVLLFPIGLIIHALGLPGLLLLSGNL